MRSAGPVLLVGTSTVADAGSDHCCSMQTLHMSRQSVYSTSRFRRCSRSTQFCMLCGEWFTVAIIECHDCTVLLFNGLYARTTEQQTLNNHQQQHSRAFCVHFVAAVQRYCFSLALLLQHHHAWPRVILHPSSCIVLAITPVNSMHIRQYFCALVAPGSSQSKGSDTCSGLFGVYCHYVLRLAVLKRSVICVCGETPCNS